MDHIEDSLDKFINTKNFVKMLFTLLAYSQHTKSREVCSMSEKKLNSKPSLCSKKKMLWRLYPVRNTSASLSRAELIRMGKGYFSNNLGKRTIASHCSPILTDLSPLSNSVRAVLASCSGSPNKCSLKAVRIPIDAMIKLLVSVKNYFINKNTRKYLGLHECNPMLNVLTDRKSVV